LDLTWADWTVINVYKVILPIVALLALVHVCYELSKLIGGHGKLYQIVLSLSIMAILGFLLQIIMSTTPIPSEGFTIEEAIEHLKVIGLFVVGMTLNMSVVLPIYRLTRTTEI
jgi:hypothetical protein